MCKSPELVGKPAGRWKEAGVGHPLTQALSRYAPLCHLTEKGLHILALKLEEVSCQASS
jgi:hypothetical protein